MLSQDEVCLTWNDEGQPWKFPDVVAIMTSSFNQLHSINFIHSASPLPIQVPRYKASLLNAANVDVLYFNKSLEPQLSEIKDVVTI